MKPKKKKGGFPDDLLRDWEGSDGVNFAIALARLTGWLLHVDWWTPAQNAPLSDMKSLRVYVGTDGNVIYDFLHGKKGIRPFAEYVITPILQKRVPGRQGGVLTRYYSEEKLFTLPLRVKPDQSKIAKAQNAILANTSFLEKIPKRVNAHIPAHKAALFSFGRCAVFASAMQEVTGLPAVAIIAKKYSDMFAGSKTGFSHSVVLHPDGEAEDAWGKQPLESVLERYGIIEYELSETTQLAVDGKLKSSSPDEYAKSFNEAVSLISASGEKAPVAP